MVGGQLCGLILFPHPPLGVFQEYNSICFIPLCVCVWAHISLVCIWRSEDNLCSLLPLYRSFKVQVRSLGGGGYPLRHLIGPETHV